MRLVQLFRTLVVLVLSARGGLFSSTAAMKLTGNQPPPTLDHGNRDRSHSISFDVAALDKTGAPSSASKPKTSQSSITAGNRTFSPSMPSRGQACGRNPVEVILAIDAVNAGKEALTEEFDWLHKYLDNSGKQLALPLRLPSCKIKM